jgi:hypothetical protein
MMLVTRGSLAAAVAGHPAVASEAEIERAEAVEDLTRVARELFEALRAAGVQVSFFEAHRIIIETAEKWED